MAKRSQIPFQRLGERNQESTVTTAAAKQSSKSPFISKKKATTDIDTNILVDIEKQRLQYIEKRLSVKKNGGIITSSGRKSAKNSYNSSIFIL